MVSKNESSLKMERVKELLELRSPENKFYNLNQRSNRLKIDAEAGYLNKVGYRRITIDGNEYAAHRLVWFITYGKFPNNFIDHINGVRDDNRIENLRDVPLQINNQNHAKHRRVDAELPTGVCVGNRNKFGDITCYRAQWFDAGSNLKTAFFPLSVYTTHEAAIAAATARRNVEISNLKLKGAAYTDRHGT